MKREWTDQQAECPHENGFTGDGKHLRCNDCGFDLRQDHMDVSIAAIGACKKGDSR
jgi:hypothetical protein